MPPKSCGRGLCKQNGELDELICKCTLKPLFPSAMAAAAGETPVGDGAQSRPHLHRHVPLRWFASLSPSLWFVVWYLF